MYPAFPPANAAALQQQQHYFQYLQSLYAQHGAMQPMTAALDNRSPSQPSNTSTTDPAPSGLASAYARDEQKQLLWFAAPPVRVMPVEQPTHSLAYLQWKKQKQQLQQQQQ